MVHEPVSVVLFDLGGVVCPFDPAPRLTRLAALSHLTEDEVRARIFESGLTADFDRGRYTSAEWHELVCNELGVTLSFDEFEDVMLNVVTLDPVVLHLVHHLSVRVALLTDNPPMMAEAMPRRFPALVGVFEPMIFSDQLGVLKPELEAFRLAVERIGVPAGDVLFIDDTAANVEGARAAGLQAYHFTSSAALAQELHERGLLEGLN